MPVLPDTLIYTTAGIYRLPGRYIKVGDDSDMPSKPISLYLRNWLEMKHRFNNFSTESFLEMNNLDVENILVVTDGAERFTRTLWFTCFSVDGDNSNLNNRFGRSFLWQVPGKHANAMYKLMQSFGDHSEYMNALLSNPADIDTEFNVRDFPGCKLVTHMSNYFDRVFAMSVKPAESVHSQNRGKRKRNCTPAVLIPDKYAKNSDQITTCSMPGRKPVLIDAGSDFNAHPKSSILRCGPLRHCLRAVESMNKVFCLTMLDGSTDDIHRNFRVRMTPLARRGLVCTPNMCPDISSLIMQHAVDNAMDQDNLRGLLKLRLVNKQFRSMVDNTVVDVHKHMGELSDIAHDTDTMPSLYIARDAFLANRMCSIQFISEHTFTSFHSFVRLRTGKRHSQTPYMPGTRLWKRFNSHLVAEMDTN